MFTFTTPLCPTEYWNSGHNIKFSFPESSETADAISVYEVDLVNATLWKEHRINFKGPGASSCSAIPYHNSVRLIERSGVWRCNPLGEWSIAYVRDFQLLTTANGCLFCSRRGDPQASNKGNQTAGGVVHLCLQPQIHPRAESLLFLPQELWQTDQRQIAPVSENT